MNDNFKKFLTNKKHIKTLIVNLIIFALIFSEFMSNRSKHHSVIFYGFVAVAIFFIIYVLVNISISYYLDEVKKIPDLAISDSKIIFFYGTFKRKKIMKISDIESVYVPKWDEYIKITFKGKIEINLSLIGYSEESKQELRNIFNEIKVKIEGEEKNSKSSTYFLANGEKYIKKQL